MQITSEEMDVLNRAYEILSKYAAEGGLTRNELDHFEKMITAIVDEHGDTDYLQRKQAVERICSVFKAIAESAAKGNLKGMQTSTTLL